MKGYVHLTIFSKYYFSIQDFSAYKFHKAWSPQEFYISTVKQNVGFSFRLLIKITNSKGCTKTNNHTFNHNVFFKKKNTVAETILIFFKFLIMSSRWTNHMSLNPCKFSIVFRTRNLHFHSMFFFKRPQDTETFSTLHESHHEMIHHGWGVWISPFISPPMWSWQLLKSTAKQDRTQGIHHFIYFTAQTLVL